MMHQTPPPEMVALLNKIDALGRVLMFAVPTRILRLVDPKGDWLTFEVQQLVNHGTAIGPLRASWRALSKHVGQRPGESMQPAVNAMHTAQKNLIAKARDLAQARADEVARLAQKVKS